MAEGQTELEDVGDATRSKVPLEKRLSFGSNLVILFGFVLVISSLLVGGTIGAMLPFRQAVIAILFAGAFNALLAVLIGVIAARSGYTSALIYRYSFGRVGSILPNLVMAFTGVVWFAVILNITRDAFVNIFDVAQGSGVYWLATLVIALLFMIPAFMTIRWISYIDWIAAPAIILILGVTTYFALDTGGGISGIVAESPEASVGLLVAFTIAAGGWIQGNTVIADFARFFKNGRQAAIGLFVTYGIMMVFQYIGAAMGAIATDEWNIFLMMEEFGLLEVTFAALFLASWSTAMAALYGSANMVSAPPVPEFRSQEKHRKTAVVVLFALALVFSVVGAEQVFDFLLQFLAWIIGPIAITIIIDYWLLPRKRDLYERSDLGPDSVINPAAYLAWFVGFPAGYFTQDVFISLINGMVVAGIIYYGWMRYALDRGMTPENQIRGLIGKQLFDDPYDNPPVTKVEDE